MSISQNADKNNTNFQIFCPKVAFLALSKAGKNTKCSKCECVEEGEPE